MSDAPEIIGLDLEQFRRIEGLTLDDLAKMLGISSRTGVRNYAVGKYWPSRPEMVERILEIGGGRITLDALFARHRAYRQQDGKWKPMPAAAE